MGSISLVRDILNPEPKGWETRVKADSSMTQPLQVPAGQLWLMQISLAESGSQSWVRPTSEFELGPQTGDDLLVRALSCFLRGVTKLAEAICSEVNAINTAVEKHSNLRAIWHIPGIVHKYSRICLD